ncbi:uncharacterized protein PAC_17765 [Phialocephala subalpina]|uniref:Trichothecene 3-O-acetyltransferase n=1 Tax=Phialocephala subalpina TaxID=576137 RepID=A0A1L7XS35_9HELO|nr:uncharacterized protein PAC_17765 [Phialocephala subalpina]
MDTTASHIPLSPLDHALPGNYTCTVCYLPLKPDVSFSKAFEFLQEGLQRIFVQAGGQDSAKSAGFILGYDELRDSGFPIDTFDDAFLTWFPFFSDTNDGPDVFVAQANFLPGGGILAASMHHLASDGTALYTILKLWADHCNSLQSENSQQPEPPAPESPDRSLLDSIWAKEVKEKSMDNIDPETWTVFAAVIPANRVLKSAIFYISPANLAVLHSECDRERSRVSENDLVCALIWRSMPKARTGAARVSAGSDASKSDASKSDESAHLGMSFDARPNFGQSVPPSYLGNLAMLHHSRMPFSCLTAPETSISIVARIIRETANSITTAMLLDAYTLERGVLGYESLVFRPTGIDGSTTLISSLLMLPIYDASFGDFIFGNKGMPEAVRPLMGPLNCWTRIGFVLPRKTSGGVEFAVTLFDGELELLGEDKGFSKYAMLLC